MFEKLQTLTKFLRAPFLQNTSGPLLLKVFHGGLFLNAESKSSESYEKCGFVQIYQINTSWKIFFSVQFDQ